MSTSEIVEEMITITESTYTHTGHTCCESEPDSPAGSANSTYARCMSSVKWQLLISGTPHFLSPFTALKKANSSTSWSIWDPGGNPLTTMPCLGVTIGPLAGDAPLAGGAWPAMSTGNVEQIYRQKKSRKANKSREGKSPLIPTSMVDGKTYKSRFILLSFGHMIWVGIHFNTADCLCWSVISPRISTPVCTSVIPGQEYSYMYNYQIHKLYIKHQYLLNLDAAILVSCGIFHDSLSVWRITLASVARESTPAPRTSALPRPPMLVDMMCPPPII